MPDDLLAYHLIKSANLSKRYQQLVKATINKLSYDISKSNLIKIFLEDNEIPTIDFKELHIKQETTYHAQNYLYDEVVGPKEEEIFIEGDKTTQKESYQTLYTQKENPHHSNISTRQLAVNNNPNRNPSNPNRVSQDWRSTSNVLQTPMAETPSPSPMIDIECQQNVQFVKV